MSDPKKGEYKTLMRDVADRMEAARAVGEQLTFLADADGQGGQLVPDDTKRKAGRPEGSKNKGSTQLRDMLAARGYQMPEDVMAEIAGLSARGDAIEVAMQRTEALIAWAGHGAEVRIKTGKDSYETRDWEATPAQRMAWFFEVFKTQLKALDAVLPYGLAKITPEVNVTQAVQVVLPSSQGGSNQVQSTSDFAPPPLPVNSQQKQQVIEGDPVKSDRSGRTE